MEEHLPAAEPHFWGLQSVSRPGGPSEWICWREDDSLLWSTPSQCHSDPHLHRKKPEGKRTNSPEFPAFPLFLTFFFTSYLGDWKLCLNSSCCWWTVTPLSKPVSELPSLMDAVPCRWLSFACCLPAWPERTPAPTQKQGVFLWFRQCRQCQDLHTFRIRVKSRLDPWTCRKEDSGLLFLKEKKSTNGNYLPSLKTNQPHSKICDEILPSQFWTPHPMMFWKVISSWPAFFWEATVQAAGS